MAEAYMYIHIWQMGGHQIQAAEEERIKYEATSDQQRHSTVCSADPRINQH